MPKRILASIIKKTFPLWQSMGFHITPNHYYEPIPDTRKLKRTLWQHKEISYLRFNLTEQINLLQTFKKKYKKEYSYFSSENDHTGQYFLKNKFYGPVDAEILYCMIRSLKPKAIIELGSGFSSLVISQAILKNKQQYKKYIVNYSIIDPFSKTPVKNTAHSKLIKKNIQDIDLKFFKQLNKNDILFIDTSHMVKIGSDVNHILLNVLPVLKKCVVVQFHNIFLPNDYPKEFVLKKKRFWNEQYFLQAFLAFNSNFKIIWSANFFKEKYGNKLASAFNSYDEKKVMPSSFWIKKLR